jgi:hypothetical protein
MAGKGRRRSLIGDLHMKQQKRFSVTDMANPQLVTRRRNRGSVIEGIAKFREKNKEVGASDAKFRQWAPDGEVQSTKVNISGVEDFYSTN